MWQAVFTLVLVAVALLAAGGLGFLGIRLLRDGR